MVLANQNDAETFYRSGGNLELDIYGGYKSEIGKTGSRYRYWGSSVLLPRK
jgi:hypothetical protein